MRSSTISVLVVVLLLGFGARADAKVTAKVAALQVALRAAGDYAGTVDGVMGPGTRTAIRTFQASNGLVVDGVAGPQTRRALGRRGRPLWGRRDLRSGRSGWDVAVLQFKLARRGFPSGTFDGVFGTHVDGALRRFQAWAGLPADGVAGSRTRKALRRRPARSPLHLLRPVDGPLGDRFGPRDDRFHSGVDFTVGLGHRTQAAGRGCVESAGWDPGGYGNLVVLRHRAGVTTWYAHLDSIAVSAGQCVDAGATVGAVGSTGNSTGPHSHFEVRLRGAAVDPLSAFH